MRLKPVLAWSALTLVSLGLALGLATLIRLQFLVSEMVETDPPVCYNHYGDTISCSLRDEMPLIYLGFIAGLFALFMLSAAVVRKRSRRVS